MGQKRSIAFVDDDRNLARKLIDELLKLLSDCEFIYYPSGDSLLGSMRVGKRYDVYLVDFNLEFEFGWQVVQKILEKHAAAVVIGMSTDQDAGHFKEVGAKGFVCKTAGAQAMAKEIRKYL